MRLHVGERLEGAGPAQQPGGYVVTAVVRETPWHGLYLGKKIFYNFDFTAKRVRETDEVEWLDVFLRTNCYPILDDPQYVQQRRALARAEVRTVLGNRHCNLWPEPLDLLEIDNTRDRFRFAASAETTPDPFFEREPVVVYARPHGRFTPDWQQQILPVSSILSVLAELLEFIRQAHAEGLLLLGLGPESLLIDASDRVHFVGTEMVLSQQSALLTVSSPRATWQRLFPADRFTPGYAAAECFDAEKRPDARADLFAWGALAFSLLTGHDSATIAREQGRPWPTFRAEHWAELERTLAELPRNSLQLWAEQIGVAPARLLDAWPKNGLALMRLLLSPDPARRPSSAAQLQAWLTDPPPPPVAELIALHTDADTAKLLLDCTDLDADLEMTIQCTRGEAAREPTDGASAADGPVRPVVGLHNLPVTAEPIYYTVFTRRRRADATTHSAGVSALLWQPTEANLRQWVEEQAVGTLDGQPMPTRVAMVLGAVDARLAAESLLASALPRVRAWSFRRLEQTVRGQGRLDSCEGLLWRYLSQPDAETRQAAATLLWNHHPQQSDDLLLRIVGMLEAPPIEAPIPIAHFLRQLQAPEDRVRRVLLQWETKRPAECPLCKKPFTLGERAAHLQAEHGYLPYRGDVMAPEALLARLWGRVLEQGDRQAHEELTSTYLNLGEVGKNQDAAIARYLADLRRHLLRDVESSDDLGVPVAVPYDAIVAFHASLRASGWFLPIVRRLLDAPIRRLRELGADAAIPYVQAQLPGNPSVVELRRLLDAVCLDHERTGLQIELCGRLAQAGVDAALVNKCLTQLREERLVACPECRASVQARDLEWHLRRAHQIFQFRDRRGDYPETRAEILKAVCALPSDVGAWGSLRSLALDRHPQDTDRHLIAWLYQFLKDSDDDARGAAIAALAENVVAAEAAEALLPLFIGPAKNATWELLGQRIGLEVCARLDPPLPPGIVPTIAPLLDSKDLPRRARQNAVLSLLRGLGKDDARAVDLLRAYVAQSSKKRGIEKLQKLEQRFGHSAAIDVVTRELDDEIRMSCPRCATELRKKDMVGHLWDQHRLYLDGERVREPWRVIEDWAVDYGLEKDAEVLRRCRDLAAKDDPNTGLARLHRLLYRRGVRERELLNELRTLAQGRNATLCPHCCAAVAMEDRPDVQPLALAHSSLEGFGYELEVSERGLAPTLRIESPDAILYRGREPARFVTRFGGILFVVGPVMTGLFILLLWLTQGEQPPGLILSVAIGVGLVIAGFLYLIWPSPRPAKERLVRAAWKLLVPEMVQEEMGRREWGFLHGLVRLSDSVPPRQLNQDLLLECCEEASEAGKRDPLALVCLASLSRRCIADLRDTGGDPFDFILTLAAECFKGKLPLSVLSDLLANFHGPERGNWGKVELNRLPILIAQRAFPAEVDIDDWFNLGRAFPVLGSVLFLEQHWHWLQFHAIWTHQNRKPWENAGSAKTMLEIAAAPEQYEDVLAYYPDVLLYIPRANLVIGSRGVWIEGVCVTWLQPGAEVSIQRSRGEMEIVIGAQRIRCADDPGAHLAEITRWLRWYFQEFLPTVPNTPRPSTESAHRMWQLGKVACPECGRMLFPCPGDLGVALR